MMPQRSEDLLQRSQLLVVAAVIRQDSSVLLVRQRDPETSSVSWALPGGLAKGWELLTEALAREVYEETGLLFEEPKRLAYVVQLDQPFERYRSLTFVFEVEEWIGSLKPADPDHLILDAEFVPLSEALERLQSIPWRAMREPIIAYLREEVEAGSMWLYRTTSPGEDELVARLPASELWEESEAPRLTREQMLAAELYGYSYEYYADHLGIGNIRFEWLMPESVEILEQAIEEEWSHEEIAEALEVPETEVETWLRLYREAKAIVDAPTPAEGFRRGVRFSIQHALEEGLGDKASIERLVTQIGYRAADLAFRLDMERRQLSDYLDELRHETVYDREYWQQQLKERLPLVDEEAQEGPEPEDGEEGEDDEEG